MFLKLTFTFIESGTGNAYTFQSESITYTLTGNIETVDNLPFSNMSNMMSYTTKRANSMHPVQTGKMEYFLECETSFAQLIEKMQKKSPGIFSKLKFTIDGEYSKIEQIIETNIVKFLEQKKDEFLKPQRLAANIYLIFSRLEKQQTLTMPKDIQNELVQFATDGAVMPTITNKN